MDASLNLWQSMVLAIVQGITEFLPVSSSGHLVLLRKIFGWPDQGGLVFDTILHGGSLAAILIYFWREWLAIIRVYFDRFVTQSAISATGGFACGEQNLHC